jgi:hypothetical protein
MSLDQTASKRTRSHLPIVGPEVIDRLNIERALLDFEVANARVIDLTSRLTLLNERFLKVQHELSLCRLQITQVDELKSQCDFLVFERDSARQQLAAVQNSRSFKVGGFLAKTARKLIP